MEDRFETSRNFLATDKVPDTLFGFKVVSNREDYTDGDIAFFKKFPEAGGYYDLGDDGSADQGDINGGDFRVDYEVMKELTKEQAKEALKGLVLLPSMFARSTPTGLALGGLGVYLSNAIDELWESRDSGKPLSRRLKEAATPEVVKALDAAMDDYREATRNRWDPDNQLDVIDANSSRNKVPEYNYKMSPEELSDYTQGVEEAQSDEEAIAIAAARDLLLGTRQASKAGESLDDISKFTLKDFPLSFEVPAENQMRTVNGKTVYIPEKRAMGDYDVGGYASKLVNGKLVKITDATPIPKDVYEQSVIQTDKDLMNTHVKVLGHHGVDPKKLDYGGRLGLHDIVFSGGGTSLLYPEAVHIMRDDKGRVLRDKNGKPRTIKGSPLFHAQMKRFTKDGIPAHDAFLISSLLEQDSYGGLNYKRHAARGKLFADALLRSANPEAQKVGQLYLEGWKSIPLESGGSTGEIRYGTNHNKHSAGMRRVTDYMDTKKIKYSKRRGK